MARLYLALDLTLLHTPADTECVMLACVGCSVGNVVGWRMVFGVIVRHVCCTFIPIKAELSLCRTAPEPMESHPNYFYAPLDDRVVYEACCGRIVCLDWGFRLGPSHFVEGITEGNHFSGRVVEGCEFGFGC